MKTLFTLFSFVWSVSLLAGDPDLDNLIKKCKEFENNPQIKPFKTNIFCKGKRTFWELKGPDAFLLATTATVSNRAEMKDNQYVLAEKEYPISSEPSWLSCRIYREMLVVIPSVVTVVEKCSVLEEMAKIGRDEFCKKVLENEVGEPPVPTGKTYTTCPSQPLDKVNIGAEFDDVIVKVDDNVYQGVRVKNITDEKGIIYSFHLGVGDTILYINERRMSNIDDLITTFNRLAGLGSFKLVYLKAGTNQLVSITGNISF